MKSKFSFKSLDFSFISKYRSEIMGFAALWIVFHHFQNNMVFPDSMTVFRKISNYGNSGVEIFLFVSGLGLYFSFQKSRKIGPFYKKRIRRILIPYLLICVPFYLWSSLTTGTNFVLDVTQLSFPLSKMITTWYIPAITVFYLAFPLIYFLQNDLFPKNRTFVTVLMCSLYAGLLLIVKHFLPTFYFNTEIALTRAVIFMIGCYFGKAVFDKNPLSHSVILSSFVFLFFYCVAFRETVSLSDYWIRMSYIPFAMSVIFILTFIFAEIDGRCKFVLKFFRFFGDRSLELYLTHILVNNIWAKTVGARHFDSHGFGDYAIIIAVSLVLTVIYHFIITKINTFFDKKKL